MTTIAQLPAAITVTPAADQLPLQQGGGSGLTASVTPLALLQGAMAAWILSLPTTPPVSADWWNNSGIPTLGAFAVIPNSIATIAALRAATTATVGPAQSYVLGYHANADGGEGVFVYVSTDTTSADNGGTIIVDASGRRWYRLTGGRVTAAMFGCDMTGATDSTAAFQAALAGAYATNGVLYIGAGTIQISSITLSANTRNLAIVGAGQFATTITTNSATANVLALTFAELAISGVRFSSSVTRTAGAYLTSTCNIELFEDIGFNGHYIGIVGKGNDGTWRDFIFTNPAAGATGATVSGYAASLMIDNLTMYQGSFQAACGINLQNCAGGVIIREPNISGQGQNLLINPGTGQGVFSTQVSGGYLDSGTYGIAINPSGNGNVVRIKFVGVETNSNTTHGVLVENNGTGIVQGVEFINHMGSLNTAGSGIAVAVGSGSSPTGVSIIGGTFAGNSTGINIGAGVTDFSITGVQSGSYGGSAGNTTYGIFVAAGASNHYVIANNSLLGNGTLALDDLGTGTIKSLSGNLGFNPAGAVTVTLTGSPFTFTNGLGYPVVMAVLGGTVSSVTLNGLNVASSPPCSVVVPNGIAFTVTYTSAPTIERIGI